MAGQSITSANAIYMLSIASLYGAPQQLQGFAADDIFDTGSINPAEVIMGVDGKLSAGFVPVAIPQNIMLMANSASIDLFDNWYQAQYIARDIYFAQATIVLPSIGKQYTMTNGVLQGYAPIPDAKKVLQARRFSIVWESVVGASS